MELYAMNIQLFMPQGHNLTIIAHSSHLQAVGEASPVDHPTVISTHHDALRQSLEHHVVVELRALGGHTMIHIGQVGEPSPKHLGNGLMPKTYSQDGLAACIRADDIEQQPGL